MSIVKRFNRLLGLEKIDVLVDEKDKSRHIIISDMPESLPQGKSSFLIEVSPYMRKGIELQIDFIDSKGNSIYVEPVSNYLEGTSRTVSVEVYNTVAPGVATMIIVGELEGLPVTAGNFSETEEIPDEFKGVYNVRLTKEVIINTAEINTQPIKFYSSPRLTAVEKRFGSMEREVVTGETTSSVFSITGKPIQQEPFSIYTPNESEVDALGAGVTEIDEVPKPPDGNIKGDKADIERLKRSSKKRSVRGDTRFKRSKRIRRRRSPEEYPYVFTINDSNHEFTTEEIGGEIKFSNIKNIYDSQQLEEAGLDGSVSFNVVSNTKDENFPTHYTASIAKLENNKTAFVNTPFTKQDKNGDYRLLPMEATAKVHYTKEPSASYSITNIVSYADITLSHLRTFSGEVFKAKVYVKAEGSFDEYKLLAEVPVESPELMVDNSSVGVGQRTAYFEDDLDLNKYWEKFGGTNGLSPATSTTTASFDNDGSLDSVMISGSISSFTDQIRFQQKDAYKFNLTKGIDYDLSFNAVGEKGTDGRALLMIYVSGSALKQKDNLHFDEKEGLEIIEPSQYGRRMGVLEVEAGDDVKKEFGLIRHNFNSNLTGDAKVQFRIISGKWNLSDISVVPSTDTGFSPSFVNFKQELPPELTHKRPEKLEFLTEFYDINNNLADEIAVTTGSVFTGGNMVITGDDNVLSHNMFIGGDTTGSGIHMGGTSSTLPDDNYSEGATGSGFIRSIGYLGFESASNSALGGKKGFMIYSGSVLPNSGEDYKGVGLELVGASGSLKFRTSPSVFDVQADSFFVGKTNTQFISGSGEKIEISSSNFHVTPEGNVTMSGTITAEAGNIGGFNIEDNRLTAGAGNSSVTMSGQDQLFRFGSGSVFNIGDIDGVLFGKDTDGKYKFGVGKGDSYILFDGTSVNIRSEDINVTASVFSIDVDVFKLSSNNLFISSSQGGFISAGNPRPTGITGTNKGVFIVGRNPSDAKPKFLAGAANGPRLSFDGDNIFMSSSAFFLGSPSQFVSGSEGNIEISSSNFHLTNAGNVIVSGKVTANEGSIGGFNITNDALSSANFLISGSSTGNNFFISSSNFNVKASGDVTASALDLTGGAVGGIAVSEGEVSVGSILKLKDSGQITGSSVLFSGGTIGGFTLSSGGLTDSANSIQLSSTQASMSLGTGQEVLIRGNSNSPFISIQPSVALVDKSFGEVGVFFGVAGGSTPLFSAVGSGGHLKFNGSTIDINTNTAVISGSSIRLESPRFFLGKASTNFISGSNGNIEISSSKFHLTRQGNVTGSAILLGNKSAGQFLQFVNNTLTVQGAITADSIAVPSAAPTPSSSISSGGLLKTVSASIGGFDITSDEIKDSGDNLRLKSSGQITGSNVLLTGGKIAAWNISGNNISSTGGGIRLNGNGNSAEISVNSHTFASEGIQFGFNSGNPRFYVGDGAQNFLRYDSSNGVNIKTLKATISGSEITLETPKFFLGKKSNQFVSGSNGNIEISSSNFHLTSQGNVTMSGEITAAGGTIGGFTIGDDLSNSAGSTLKLKGSSGQITASAAQITGDITANTITANNAGTIANFNISSTEIASSNNKLRLKSNGQITASAVSMSGTVTATAGNIAGFQISGTKLQQGTSFHLDGNSSATYFISSSNFAVTPDGDLSASNALFDGTIDVTGTGTIAGWDISSERFADSTDEIRLDSDVKAITIKNHSFGQSGIQLQFNGGTSRFYVGNGTNRFIKFDGNNVDIETGRLTASGSSVSIETPSFFFGKKNTNFISGSNNLIEISSSKFHLQRDGDVVMNDITASNANLTNVNASGKITATSGEVGGFTISSTQIDSENLVLNSNGIIQTSNFASGQTGWRISSIGNGEAEFQNIKIRGTLSTAVFEKESVNAVGGQLYIANSTVITGSVAISASAATMSVANVGGFVANEILSAKKISGTGFNTEYMLVQSASRDFPSSENDFRGKLFVVRGYRSGSAGASGSLGDSAGISQSLDPGQVIVSTGKVGTGFIRLNANPNDTTTPYMDIVERTGSGVYDVELKARLGDLSGLSSGLLYGNASPGFGLFTENVFLQGAITATTGSFTGKVHVGATNGIVIDGNAKKLFQGVGTHNNQNTGFYMDSTGKFSLGDKLVWDGSTLTVTGAINITAGTGFATPASVSGSFDAAGTAAALSTGAVASASAIGIGATASASAAQSSAQTFASAIGTGAAASASAAQSSAQTFASAIGTGAAASASAAQSSAETFASAIGTGAAASASAAETFASALGVGATASASAAETFASALGVGATASASAAETFASALGVGATASASAAQTGAETFASAIGEGATASASAAQTNAEATALAFSEGAAASASAVQSNLNSVSSSTAARIVTDANSKIIVPNSTPSGNGLFLTSEFLGYYNSGWNAFIQNNGNFLFKADNNNLVSFGTSVNGGDGQSTTNFVLKAQNAILSGSSVSILTERFFLGGSSQFVSGSNGNIEISSSKFHIQRDGDVIMNQITASDANVSGKITTTEGSIGGFDIGTSSITSQAGGLTLNADGGITGSKFLLQGGIITSDVTIEGDLSANSISTPTGGSPKAQITAQGFARFVSASIGGFDVDGTTISDTSNNLVMSSSGQITGSKVLFEGGKVGGWTIGSSTLTGGVVTLNSAGSIEVGSLANATTTATTNSGFFADASGNVLIKGNTNDKDYIKFSAGGGIDINTQTATISGSSIIIKTNDFFLGKTGAQFISGSNNNIEISSSAFHLDPSNNTMTISGSITATDGNIGGFTIDSDEIKSTAGGSNTSLTVTAPGGSGEGYRIDNVVKPTLTFVVGNTYVFDISSGTLGSHPFRIGTSANGGTITDGVTITSSTLTIVVTSSTPTSLYYFCTAHSGMGNSISVINPPLVLNGALGQITASAAQITGKITAESGTIGGFNIGTDLDSTSGTLKLKGASGQITASDALINGNITATTINATGSGVIGGFSIDQTTISSSNSNLILRSSGQITASSALINGNITAETINATGSGVIGGFTLSSNEIRSSNNLLRLKSNGQITASAVSMSGTIVADSGNIGGFTIDSDEIKSTALAGETVNYTVTNNGSSYYLIDGANQPALTFVVGNTYVFTMASSVMSNHPFRIGTSSNGGVISDGVTVTSTSLTIVVSASTPTSLYYFCTAHSGMGNSITVNAGIPKLLLNGALGQITASAANITGDITANTITANTAGTIGGFTLNSVGLISSDGELVLSGSGQITASAAKLTSADVSGKITATSGEIGGFTIDADEIKSGTNIGLNSNTKALTINNTTFGNDGVQLEYNSGNPRFYVGNGSNRALIFDGTNIHISGSNFTLDGARGAVTASDMLLSGNITATTINATGSGVIGGFTLSSTEISASGLLLKSSGQITASAADLSGKITATSGEIAAYEITDTKLQKITDLGNGSFTSMSFSNTSTGGNIKLSSFESASVEKPGAAIIATTRNLSADIFVISRVSSSATVKAEQALIADSGQTRFVMKAVNDNGANKDNFIEISNNPQTTGTTIFTGATTVSGSLTVPSIAEARTRATSTTTGGGLILKKGGLLLQVSGSGPSFQPHAHFFVGETDGGHIFFDGEESNISISASAFELSNAAQVTTDVGGSDANYGGVRIGRPIRQHTIINDGGMFIRMTGDTIAAFEGTNATIGQTTGTNNNVFIDSNSVDIRRGTQISASFGTTTTIGPTTGKHIKIDGTSLEIKTDANTTALSASVAGLEMSGKVISTEGTIGGWSMTTSSFFSGDTGDRMEFQSNNNRIVLYDAAKSSLAGDELIQIGQLSSAGEVVFGSSVYGIKISGSNSSMGSNEAKLVGQMGDHGATATNFHYTSSVIQGYSKSRNPNNIYGGRAGIYGRSSFALSSIPAGYIGSLSSQQGIMAGIVGSHLNHGSGYYRKTAGILGVSSELRLRQEDFGKKIATGSFGVVSVGPMYVTASTVDHREDGIGYSILAGGGYVHVSASSAGNFGGIGSGVIIDSSNTSGTSAGLRLVSDSSNTTEITSNGSGIQINKGVINTTGDTTFSGSYFASTGLTNRLDGGVVATSFARNGSVGVTINHSAGGITAGGDLDVGGTYTNNTQPAFLALNSSTDNNLSINTLVKIEFNSEVYDQASNYDNSTDTFTAPVTGKYLLTTQLRLDDIDTAADWTSIRIVTSNREYRRFIDPNFSADLNQFGMNMTVIADMDAGDTAHVEFKQSGGTAQVDVDSGNPGLSTPQLDSFFSGYLLG